MTKTKIKEAIRGCKTEAIVHCFGIKASTLDAGEAMIKNSDTYPYVICRLINDLKDSKYDVQEVFMYNEINNSVSLKLIIVW